MKSPLKKAAGRREGSKRKKLKDFAAIDFETANKERTSVCSVGIVIVKDGAVADSFYSLIRPKPNYYTFTWLHGIAKEATKDAPPFPEVWAKAAALIGDLPLVAHFSPFDEGCLKAAFELYGMEYPGYTFYCTYRAARRALPDLPNHKLATVAARCGFNLKNHHNALADAEACAWIAMKLL